MVTYLKIFVLLFSAFLFGCGDETPEEKEAREAEEAAIEASKNYNLSYRCINLDEFNGSKVWVSDSIGNRIYHKPLYDSYNDRGEFNIESVFEREYGINIRDNDSDINVLFECSYTTYGKLYSFTPIPTDDLQPEWNKHKDDSIFFISPLSDIYSKLYFETKKQGYSTKNAANNSIMIMHDIFEDSPNYLVKYSYIPDGSEPGYRLEQDFIPLVNELLFIITNTQIVKEFADIHTELVRQLLYDSYSPYFGDYVYAAFLHNRVNLLLNGEFDEVNNNRPNGWIFYNETDGKSVTADNFIVFGDNRSLHLELTSNRKTEEGLAAYGFYQDKYIGDVNLNKLFLSVSYRKMLGELELGVGLQDASGAASIIIQYIDKNNITIGWTNLINTAKMPFADTVLAGSPESLKSTPTTKVIPIPEVNRDILLNISRDISYFNYPNEFDITNLRIWIIVTDYVGFNYMTGGGLVGLLYNSVAEPGCRNCKSEADITSVSLFTLD